MASSDQRDRLAQPAEIFDIAAEVFGLRSRDIVLYARYMREFGQTRGADLWPALSHGRGPKFEVNTLHVACLISALATSRVAAAAGEHAMAYTGLLSGRFRDEEMRLALALSILLLEQRDDYDVEFWEALPMVTFIKPGDNSLLLQDRLDIEAAFTATGQGQEAVGRALVLDAWRQSFRMDSNFVAQRRCRVPGFAIGRFARAFRSCGA